ncbi:MAG: ATP-grasp domain-containing protein [Spirochaetaceae bacterium]|nr:ATP-grasp domain-containing protein [Spirochaetaceae bacterium]
MKQEKKHVLILGAGIMQKPAILAAKSLGYTVTVIDANSTAPCISLADNFYAVDLKDKESVKKLALKLKDQENLSAVFTAGTDFSTSVSYASEACDFKCHKYQAAQNASNKALMRTCFNKNHIPSPAFIEVSNNELENINSLDFKAKKLEFPLVVKPVDNMGGRGCRLAREKNELQEAISSAIKNSRSGKVILENYMDGPEFSIDALVYNGTVTICGFADRHIFFPPYFIEMGHTMPSVIDEKNRLELIKTFVQGIESLGLTHGAAKADIKLTKNGPMIGEIAARLSGGYMSGWTYPYASDCNLTEQALLIALDLIPEWLEKNRKPIDFDNNFSSFKVFEVPCKRTCSERAWISIPGQVSKIYNLEESTTIPFVNDLFVRSQISDYVTFPMNNVEKCGNIIATDKKREQAIDSCEKVIKQIILRLEANNSLTEEFLFPKELNSDFPPNFFQLDTQIIKQLFIECKNIPSFSIKEEVPVPICILNSLEKVRDWNYRTLKQTLDLYQKHKLDILDNYHNLPNEMPKVSSKSFWQAAIRGGLQGMFYVMDTALSKQKGVY